MLTLRHLIWWGVIMASCVAVLLATLLPSLEPARTPATFWFVLVCPGMALAQLLNLEDGLVEFGIGVAFSLVIGALIAMIMLYAHAWNPFTQLTIEMVIAVIAVVLGIVLVRGRDIEVTA